MVHRWVGEGLRALRGIEPYEVVQALSASRRLPVAARSGGIPVLTIWARTQAGRPLIVGLRKSGPLDQDIIGAREMTAAELARFEQWEADSDE
jgi:hypothetical protein